MCDRELACRLIHACRLAYEIPDQGLVNGGSFPSNSSAVKAEIAAVQFNAASLRIYQSPKEDSINAFYYGETLRNEAVLSFRGTLPPSFKPDKDLLRIMTDWLNDAEAKLVVGKNLAGRVHKGFLESLDALWPFIEQLKLGEVVKSGKPLLITGHSKGGALVYLAAYRLASLGIPVAAAYTFASPRTGDKTFAQAFDGLVTNACRYEYRDDIVPHVPPATGAWLNKFGSRLANMDSDAKRLVELISRLPKSYASAGTLQFMDWDNDIVGDSFTLDFQRNLHLAGLLAKPLGIVEIAKDHSSSGGYSTVACG
jgi:hypothetical protein